jgi:hypothetical protein
MGLVPAHAALARRSQLEGDAFQRELVLVEVGDGAPNGTATPAALNGTAAPAVPGAALNGTAPTG